MKRVTQTVSIEVEVTAQIDAVARKDDYGVAGSPVWWDIQPDEWADHSIEIAGVKVKIEDLPEELRRAIWEQCCDAADEWKWEGYDD